MATDSTSSHTYFTSIPWTSRLLAPPNLRISTPQSRTPKSTTEDSLFATTLATSTTIPHCLLYYPRSPAPSDLTALSILLKVENGCNGYPHILHGGIVSTLLDESMGILLQEIAERKHLDKVATGHAQGEIAEGIDAFTKTLNIEFLAPMKTPGVILAKVRVVERRGRGIKLVARLLQKEGLEEELDGGLVECARGEGVFVTPRGTKL
jgi:acyl-coenzyme A thioesterase PaaI-like protein